MNQNKQNQTPKPAVKEGIIKKGGLNKPPTTPPPPPPPGQDRKN